MTKLITQDDRVIGVQYRPKGSEDTSVRTLEKASVMPTDVIVAS